MAHFSLPPHTTNHFESLKLLDRGHFLGHSLLSVLSPLLGCLRHQLHPKVETLRDTAAPTLRASPWRFELDDGYHSHMFAIDKSRCFKQLGTDSKVLGTRSCVSCPSGLDIESCLLWMFQSRRDATRWKRCFSSDKVKQLRPSRSRHLA